MNITLQIIVSIIIAIIAATLLTIMKTGGLIDPATLIAFLVATIATALATRSAGSEADYEEEYDDYQSESQPESKPTTGKREAGQVKWFNVSKGFGFIVKDDGKEIFVHFRSIRGTGRRSLKDGQRVSFVETQGDKGPQAEDVTPE